MFLVLVHPNIIGQSKEGEARAWHQSTLSERWQEASSTVGAEMSSDQQTKSHVQEDSNRHPVRVSVTFSSRGNTRSETKGASSAPPPEIGGDVLPGKPHTTQTWEAQGLPSPAWNSEQGLESQTDT